ncbi:MAG: tRNA pseudouridine(55) synthase TruB [bacterium]|nr:tRNA pseudouridine(55) synthase TruB [bacterium]
MAEELTGVLNCDKPAGWTSFDVIRKLRRALGMKKMGHTGSLDPIATGVLVICLGRATRLVELLMAAQKEYRAWIRFGVATDTYDSEGKVTDEGDPPADLRAAVEGILPRFTGEIMQSPPPFSAAKVNGERLYKLARRGKPVHVPPRPVNVFTFDLVAIEGPQVEVLISCSKGTYVRALANDMGRVIGCGAHLAGLVRTRNGVFTVEEALGVDRPPAELREAALEKLVQPERSLAYLTKCRVSADELTRYLHGIPVTLGERHPVGTLLRVYGPEGFVGVGQVEPGPGGAVIQPRTTIVTPDS